jgi:hypothetical protein
MGFLALGFPFEAVVPMTNSLVGAASTAARPLIGLGVFASLLVVFKPLLLGLFRASVVLLSPRKSLAERQAAAKSADRVAVHRLARSLEREHPSLAAELRSLSSRD